VSNFEQCQVSRRARPVSNFIPYQILYSSYKPATSAANQLSNFYHIAAAKAAFPPRGGCAENLKKLEIYDIIKG
jgi:hypothetical protein